MVLSPSLYITGGIVLVILILIGAILSTIKKVPKNKVMIVTGFKQRTVIGTTIYIKQLLR